MGHRMFVYNVAFDPEGRTLASASDDRTVKLWDTGDWKLLRTLEGHTHSVDAVAFSKDGRLLASRENDGTVRVWRCDTWEWLISIPSRMRTERWIPCLAFHPEGSLLATVGSKQRATSKKDTNLVHIWELDVEALLGKAPRARPTGKTLHHTTAKVVLVGDSGVGKTGLGWRLAHGEFKEHASTHGQQFWVVAELGTRRKDGTECEAIVWDLAGQPDYRLTHALQLDDADLALVVFDPTDSRDPLHGVEFWLNQLKFGRTKACDAQGRCPTILVGARVDRGGARLTKE